MTGDGTSFEREVQVGNRVRANGHERTVVSIASRSTLVVDEPFNPGITSNASYEVFSGSSRTSGAYRVRSMKGASESEIGALPASGAIVDQVLPCGVACSS